MEILLGPILLETIWFWFLIKYQAVLFHQKQQTANKLEQNAFNNLVVKRYVSFSHAWSHWFDWFKLLLWSRWSWIVTAHEESLKIPVQLYSGLILLCEIEFTRKIKNCKQTWKNLNAWRPLKEAIHAILCLLGVFTWYFSFYEMTDLLCLQGVPKVRSSTL